MNLTMRLWKHPNGIWYVEFDRNRRRSLRTKDKAEARKFYLRLKKEYLQNKLAFLGHQECQSRSLGDFVDEFLAWAAETRSYDSYVNYRSSFLALNAYLPMTTSLSNIRRQTLEMVQATMAGQFKASTVNLRFKHYKASFEKAVEWEYLKTNPARGIRQLREPEAPPRYLRLQDIQAIIEGEENPHWRSLWRFFLLSGCRRREALGITWQDVSLAERRIWIRASKTGKLRTVYVTDEIMDILQELGPGVGRLWPWTPAQTTSRFHQLVRSLGIVARLHDLRHTYASYLAMAGVDLQAIQKLLGHSNIIMTQRYAHLSPTHLQAESAKIGNAYNLRSVPKKPK